MTKFKNLIDRLLNDEAFAPKFYFDIFIIGLILISIFMFITEAIDYFAPQTLALFRIFDFAILIVFLIEFLLRLWTVESNLDTIIKLTPNQQQLANFKARIRFIFTPLGMIDFLALLPLIPFLRAFRILRLLRLLKLLRYHHRFIDLLRLLKYNSLIYVTAFSFVLFTALTATIAILFVEKNASNSAIDNFGSAFWWSIVTITTVGYGDIVPVTPEGKLIAGLLMVAGLITIALFAGVVSQTLVGQLLNIRGDSFVINQLSNHIVIMGWNDKGPKLIEELLIIPHHELSIVVMAPGERPENLRLDVPYIKGSPTLEADMKKVRMELARACVILTQFSSQDSLSHADSHTILVTFTLRSYEQKLKEQGINRNATIHVCAELQNTDNEAHLRTAGANEIILSGDIGTYLLAQATMVKGISKVYDRLLHLEGDELYTTKIRTEMLEFSTDFEKLAIELRRRYKVVVLGIVREDQVILNPQEPLTVNESDLVVVLSPNAIQAELN